MWQNSQETADFVIFTEKILNGKLHSFVQWFFKLQKLNISYEISHISNLDILRKKSIFANCGNYSYCRYLTAHGCQNVELYDIEGLGRTLKNCLEKWFKLSTKVLNF